MSYSYDRIAATGEGEPYPTYKGKWKVFQHIGLNVWSLDGKGVRIAIEGGMRGWKARLEFDGDEMLRSQRPWTHGRNSEEVIESILKVERDRIKGAHMRLDEQGSALDSLG